MSIQPPAAQRKTRRRRQNCPQQWEAVGHVSAEAFELVRGPLADIFVSMIRQDLAEGRLVEVDTPEGRLLASPDQAAETTTACS